MNNVLLEFLEEYFAIQSVGDEDQERLDAYNEAQQKRCRQMTAPERAMAEKVTKIHWRNERRHETLILARQRIDHDDNCMGRFCPPGCLASRLDGAIG